MMVIEVSTLLNLSSEICPKSSDADSRNIEKKS